jgi:hypothetical protein
MPIHHGPATLRQVSISTLGLGNNAPISTTQVANQALTALLVGTYGDSLDEINAALSALNAGDAVDLTAASYTTIVTFPDGQQSYLSMLSRASVPVVAFSDGTTEVES